MIIFIVYTFYHICMKKVSSWFMTSWNILNIIIYINILIIIYIYQICQNIFVTIYIIVLSIRSCKQHSIIFINQCSQSLFYLNHFMLLSSTLFLFYQSCCHLITTTLFYQKWINLTKQSFSYQIKKSWSLKIEL